MLLLLTDADADWLVFGGEDEILLRRQYLSFLLTPSSSDSLLLGRTLILRLDRELSLRLTDFLFLIGSHVL